jgi:hypothetical protein
VKKVRFQSACVPATLKWNSSFLLSTAVTNARFAAFHGLPVVRMPYDDARSTSQIRALVTSGHPH